MHTYFYPTKTVAVLVDLYRASEHVFPMVGDICSGAACIAAYHPTTIFVAWVEKKKLQHDGRAPNCEASALPCYRCSNRLLGGPETSPVW